MEFAMVLSLRRYEPDQVQRVFARNQRDLSRLRPAPLGTGSNVGPQGRVSIGCHIGCFCRVTAQCRCGAARKRRQCAGGTCVRLGLAEVMRACCLVLLCAVLGGLVGGCSGLGMVDPPPRVVSQPPSEVALERASSLVATDREMGRHGRSLAGAAGAPALARGLDRVRAEQRARPLAALCAVLQRRQDGSLPHRRRNRRLPARALCAGGDAGRPQAGAARHRP